MPIFTILLFLFLALALWPFAARTSARREARRQSDRAEERMAIGARICEAASRDAFGVELDHALGSIPLFDEVLVRGWGNGMDGTNGQDEKYDLHFVLGSYLGDMYVRGGKAVWQFKDGNEFLYFPSSKRTVSPFELIDQKLREPYVVSLEDETARWLMPAPPEDTNANAVA